MYCPNCGKPLEEYDKFCRYCGRILAADGVNPPVAATPKSNVVARVPAAALKTAIETDEPDEVIIYAGKKHIIGLFWPIVLSPFFISLFWQVYTAKNIMFSMIFGILLTVPVIVPILKHCCEGLAITNKFVHIEHGLIETEDLAVPLKNVSSISVQQSFWGQTFGYCHLYFYANKKRQRLSYLKDYYHLFAIFQDPQQFADDVIREDEEEFVVPDFVYQQSSEL
jgi:hypothetical protein